MPDTPLIRLGTRRSPLAMAQAHEAFIDAENSDLAVQAHNVTTEL